MNETYEKWFTWVLRLGAAGLFGLIFAFASKEAWIGWAVATAVIGLLLANERFVQPWVSSHQDQVKCGLFWAGVGAVCAPAGAVIGLIMTGLLYPVIGWRTWLFVTTTLAATFFFCWCLYEFGKLEPKENPALDDTMYPTQ